MLNNAHDLSSLPPNLHPSSVHKRARSRRGPPPPPLPLTLLLNTPGTQNETILRCNWQPRTRKKERKKKKLATKKVTGMSC
jgi:hypothetical protein